MLDDLILGLSVTGIAFASRWVSSATGPIFVGGVVRRAGSVDSVESLAVVVAGALLPLCAGVDPTLLTVSQADTDDNH